MILKLDRETCLTPIATLSNRRRISNDATYEFFGYGRSGEAGAFTNLLVNAAFDVIEDNDCRDKFDVALRDNEFCFNLDGISGVCSGLARCDAAGGRGLGFESRGYGWAVDCGTHNVVRIL